MMNLAWPALRVAAFMEHLFRAASAELVRLFLGLLLGPPIGSIPVLGAGMFGLFCSISHDGIQLCEEPQTTQVVLGPAGASQDRSDRLRTKGLTEVMVHQKHPASIRVLIEMVGTSAFS
jgi:hypothetical protein